MKSSQTLFKAFQPNLCHKMSLFAASNYALRSLNVMQSSCLYCIQANEFFSSSDTLTDLQEY